MRTSVLDTYSPLIALVVAGSIFWVTRDFLKKQNIGNDLLIGGLAGVSSGIATMVIIDNYLDKKHSRNLIKS